jgi:hypothetical protein
MLDRPSDIEVSFLPDPDYLISGLTSDVTTLECIYDLIDNSIDAARNVILKTNKLKDQFGLPSSYSGYTVELTLSPEAIKISDNCSGIDKAILATKTFTIGNRSKHPYGIGHYGVGLNRAIFKLGKKVNLITDNGEDKLLLKFSDEDVRKAIQKEIAIMASLRPTGGESINVITIDDINAEVASDLSSNIWLKSATEEVRTRYGIFTKKGLRITINSIEVGTFGPSIRDPKFLEKQEREFRSSKGVNVYIEAGLHQDYKIKGIDKDHSLAKSNLKNLTSEYGWYIVCNDRIILVADKTVTSGWTTSWHNEYHGFLGWAYYVSEDPALLPWDSKKTGINTHNDAHRETVVILKQLADNYRGINRKLRRKEDGPSASSPSAKQARPSSITNVPGPTIPDKPSNASGAVSPVGTNTSNPNSDLGTASRSLPHTNNMDYLVYEISTLSRSPRIISLLQESKHASISRNPYTAIILLRVLFEAAIRDYSIRHRFYQDIKESYFSEQEHEGRPFTTKQKNEYSPNLVKMITWLLSNTDQLPSDHRRAATLSLGKFKNDLPKINGIIHEDGVLTDHTEVNQVRNNSYKALQTLLEH